MFAVKAPKFKERFPQPSSLSTPKLVVSSMSPHVLSYMLDGCVYVHTSLRTKQRASWFHTDREERGKGRHGLFEKALNRLIDQTNQINE